MVSSSASWHEKMLQTFTQHHCDMGLGGALTGLHLQANAMGLCLPQLEVKVEGCSSKTRGGETRTPMHLGCDKSFRTAWQSTNHFMCHGKNAWTAASDAARLASLEEDAAWAQVALSNGRPRQGEEGARSAKRRKLAEELELPPSPLAGEAVAQQLPGEEQQHQLVAMETVADVIVTPPMPVSSPVASSGGFGDFDLNVMPPILAKTAVNVIMMPLGDGSRDFDLNEMPPCEEME